MRDAVFCRMCMACHWQAVAYAHNAFTASLDALRSL